MPRNYCDERIATSYRDKWPELFEPAVVDPAVRFLADLAGAYLVRNTIMNLTTQDQQVACFDNVAAHLEPGGCFVIEVGVPALQRLPPGETVRPFTVTRRISASRSTTSPPRSRPRTPIG